MLVRISRAGRLHILITVRGVLDDAGKYAGFRDDAGMVPTIEAEGALGMRASVTNM